MNKHYLLLAAVLILLLVPLGRADAAPPPAAGEVLINEFVPASSNTEWVELYNTTAGPLDLSGHYIDDIDPGGKPAKLIPAGTIIPAHGFYVQQFTGYFNNSGDDVRFLDPSKQVLDARNYEPSTAEHAWYRFPDGGRWSGSQSPIQSPAWPNPGTGDIPWTPGYFEIRIFDVEQADSQLIIFPSGFSILIDVPERSSLSHKGAAFVAAKIHAITGGTHVNVGVLSHHHLDHIGSAGEGGIWALIEREGFTFDKIVDRDAGVWEDGYGGGPNNGECEGEQEIRWHNVGLPTGPSRDWLCYATDSSNTAIYNLREIGQVGSTTQIDPPNAGAVVKVIQIDAAGVMQENGTTPVAGDHSGEYKPPSENDYSITLKVTYGAIDYVTGGDTDGEYAESRDYTYNNVESVIAPLIGRVELLRVNHHGSSHSSNQYYIDTLDPDVSFISCGDNGHGHPDQNALDRLTATGEVYLTNLCDSDRNYAGVTIINGDIIVRSLDGIHYTIFKPRVFVPIIDDSS